jgi:magnesium-transporting ATPase (P-type)
MATGDNIQTAISVARDCGILVNQEVYYGDVEGNEIVWKLANAQESDFESESPASKQT